MSDTKLNIQHEPNNENQQDANTSDEEELLMKIYRVNIDKINSYTQIIQYTELIAFFSFLALLVLLCFQFSPFGIFSYFYFLIPITISIISGLITLNIIFELKGLIDKTESSLQNNKIDDKENGSYTMKVLINITGICLMAFSIVLFLRIEKYISIYYDLNIIFIPFYMAIICCLVFAVFISPGFFKGELYFEIGLTFIHIVSSSAFIFLLCYKINEPTSMKFAHVFVPYYFSIGAHLIYLIGISFIDKTKNIRKQITTSISIALLLCGGILIQIFLDRGKTINFYYVPILMYLAAFLGITLEPIIEIFKDNSEEDINENQIE